jgi:hypothetical protein
MCQMQTKCLQFTPFLISTHLLLTTYHLQPKTQLEYFSPLDSTPFRQGNSKIPTAPQAPADLDSENSPIPR